MTMENKELMITLWNHCNNRCSFCYNIGYYHFPINLKTHLSNCLMLLKSDSIKDYNYIRLIGGELFDGAIDNLNIRKEFEEILQQLEYLIDNNIIQKINIVTNLMYIDRKDLCQVLDRFKHKITLSTSYDEIGRFANETKKEMWWDNIKFLQYNYPKLEVDIGINITQPFIEKVNKKWIDEFQKKIGTYTINFNELFAGIDDKNKESCIFKNYFPKRKDFIKFLQNLKQWGYSNTISKTKNIKLIHYVFDNTGVAKLKDTNNLSNQGYIDSNILMQNDINKVFKL